MWHESALSSDSLSRDVLLGRRAPEAAAVQACDPDQQCVAVALHREAGAIARPKSRCNRQFGPCSPVDRGRGTDDATVASGDDEATRHDCGSNRMTVHRHSCRRIRRWFWTTSFRRSCSMPRSTWSFHRSAFQRSVFACHCAGRSGRLPPAAPFAATFMTASTRRRGRCATLVSRR